MASPPLLNSLRCAWIVGNRNSISAGSSANETPSVVVAATRKMLVPDCPGFSTEKQFARVSQPAFAAIRPQVLTFGAIAVVVEHQPPVQRAGLGLLGDPQRQRMIDAVQVRVAGSAWQFVAPQFDAGEPLAAMPSGARAAG